MKRAGLDAYLVPSTDPHQSEYTPARWKRRQWITGFTGSVGDAVITLETACLWADSRYYIQAEAELEGSGITLQRQGEKDVPTLREWLGKNLQKGQTLGVDPRLVSLKGLDQLRESVKKASAKIKLTDRNLVDLIWDDQPPSPEAPVVRHPISFAGKSTPDKLKAIRAKLSKEEAEALVVTRLDNVAWLFNLRGQDVEFTPVALSYGLLTADRALLFIDPDKVPPAVARSLGSAVELRPYEALREELRALAAAKAKVWVDPDAANAWIGQALKSAELVRKTSPIPAIKARKNAVELLGARRAHLRDGLALVRFFCWLEGAVGHSKVTELDAAARIEGLRAEHDLYRGPSFRTISAFGSHGAIVHYAPTAETDRRLRPGGIYLLDSGGQYLDGTTDVTRTVLLGGEASTEQRDQFTRVLKGAIALARAKFPAGTMGMQLDAFARRSLWEAGLDYGHGTGHGVGSYLGVHESPPGVAPPKRMVKGGLEVGQILSDEPGYYRQGRYGFRTENLVLVVRDEELSRPKSPFLRFETLTLCPIDRRLIEPALLDEVELRWLNDYHDEVLRRLSPELSPKEADWLEAATQPL
jgi:Xaa-Pro aminopeptidase